MDAATAKRACESCRLLKVKVRSIYRTSSRYTDGSKCSRTLPQCRQCGKAGRNCSYPEKKQIRFRDETDNASSLAIRKWRARSSKAVDAEPQTPIRLEVIPDVVELARQRFLYDFSETEISPFGFELRDHVAKLSQPQGSRLTQKSLVTALDAVALASFGRRDNDARAIDLATKKHSQAVTLLRESLGNSAQGVSLQTTVSAVLLGLYQNISREQELVGSWIWHFCGAVKMTRQDQTATPQFESLSRLLAKQALHVSFRLHAPIRLPDEMLAWAHKEQTPDAKTTRLAFDTAELCFHDRPHVNGNFRLPEPVLAQALALEQQCVELELYLRDEIPFESKATTPEEYPKWYRPISKHEGAPSMIHTYSDVGATSYWNVYRIAHLYLLARLLESAPAYMSATMFSGKLTTALSIIDDICASVYYIMNQTGPGRSRPNSWRDVLGAAPYGMNVLLRTLHSYTINIPFFRSVVDPAKAKWMEFTFNLFESETGISEAWIWHDERDDDERKQVLSRLSSLSIK